MQKVFNVAVDIGRKLPAPAFEVNTNDLKSVKLLITITNGQNLLNLTDTTVRIAIRKPDNHIIFQDCAVKDATNGQVEIILENQAYITPGTHTAEIMCYKGSEVVAVSGTFSYKSTKGIMNDEAVESKSEFTSISNMMKDVQETIDDIRENGTGIDAKARQDIQSVTTQLMGKASKQDLERIGSASPKGTYTTLTALQAAFPTGTTGIYVVAEDGKWYFWNGTAWTAGGQYQSSGISRNSVNPEHLSFPVAPAKASKNLFNKATVFSNAQLDSNGKVATSEGWYTSDFIPVAPNTNYYKNAWFAPFYYDSNKVYISKGTNGEYAFTTPGNAYYLRIVFTPSLPAVTPENGQVELGSVSTPYEPYGITYNSSVIKDFSTAVESKLKSTKLDDSNFQKPLVYKTIPNKNLFVKTTVMEETYISYTNGSAVKVSGSSYCASDWIEVKPNTAYHKNTFDQFAIYDANKTYISGHANNVYDFTTPANAKYVRLTVNKAPAAGASIELAQLEEGTTGTSYQTGLPLFKKEQIIDFPSIAGLSNNTVVVAKYGGDYSTIMGAVNAITDSSPTKRYTILITPGIYEETVRIQTKYIDLVAFALGGVTLISKSGQYNNPPLEMSCLNNIRNLVIISNEEKKPSGYTGEPAYAIHHDYVGEGENFIDNCKLISYSSCPIGIGTHQSQSITIKNSELISYIASRPSLLYHPKVGTATNQKLMLDNCRLKADGYSVMSIIDSNNSGQGSKDNRDTVLSFYNNVLWSKLNGRTDVLYTPNGAMTEGAIDGYIKLSSDSFGNNATRLNA